MEPGAFFKLTIIFVWLKFWKLEFRKLLDGEFAILLGPLEVVVLSNKVNDRTIQARKKN